MFLDKYLEFCDSEDVAAAAGTEVIASAIDLDTLGQRIGAGQPILYLVIGVQAAFTSGGAATVQFRLVSDSTDPSSSDGTETRHWQSEIYTMAELTAGKKLIVPLPSGDLSPYERYLQLQVVTATATTTAGTINAFLTHQPADWRAMPEANS
ncbi:MAG: hypothetical protein HC888_01415 [Candidatus Competibacteraceae bacterium]|nr:hypothetical protein [Candidatus Competibacteraceae bacterium]